MKKEDKVVKKSLRYSIIDGSFYSLMTGVGHSLIIPFALAMKATNLQIGFLSSFPDLIAPLSQFATIKAMKHNQRKSLILKAALFQAFMWIPILLIPFIILSQGPLVLVLIFSLLALFGSFIGPAWASWIGDLVPEEKRSSFFGTRNKIIGLVALISTLLAGFFLDKFKAINKIFLGFAILFFIAFVARLISISYIKKMYEPKFKLEEKYQFTFWQFIKKAPFNNFGRFTIYFTLINFTANIASPFFTVYMLKSLNFSYAQYTIAGFVSAISGLLIMSQIGKIGDKYGNISIIKISGFLIPFVPLLWLLTKNFYLILLIQVFSGIAWAAFNLSSSNFYFDSTSPQRRAACLTYLNVLTGIGVFLGGILGGYLSTTIKLNFDSILVLFIISGILRLATSLIFIPMLKEIRDTPKVNLIHTFESIVAQNFFKFTHLPLKKKP